MPRARWSRSRHAVGRRADRAVRELHARPRHGPDVCRMCFNLTDGYERCYACVHGGRCWTRWRRSPTASRANSCTTRWPATSGSPGPDRAALRVRAGRGPVALPRRARTVPGARRRSGLASTPSPRCLEPARSATGDHPLHRIVERTGGTGPGSLRASSAALGRTPSRTGSARQYEPAANCRRCSVLLIDDTWTTGANAQSAAAALKRAGAGAVAAVVIGRHVNRDWHQNDRRLRTTPAVRLGIGCALCRGADKTVISVVPEPGMRSRRR